MDPIYSGTCLALSTRCRSTGRPRPVVCTQFIGLNSAASICFPAIALTRSGVSVGFVEFSQGPAAWAKSSSGTGPEDARQEPRRSGRSRRLTPWLAAQTEAQPRPRSKLRLRALAVRSDSRKERHPSARDAWPPTSTDRFPGRLPGLPIAPARILRAPRFGWPALLPRPRRDRKIGDVGTAALRR